MRLSQQAQGLVAAALLRREEPARLLAEDAEQVARACHAMAVRFHRGGKLVVFGSGGPTTDAQHISVEFVHPVIVGKRALPAIALTNDVATVTGIAGRDGLAEVFAHQLRYLAEPEDIALGLSSNGRDLSVEHGLRTAAEHGLLTVALLGGDGGQIAAAGVAEHVLLARSHDPLVVKEVHVTTYHLLWELVHVFFEQPGLLGPEVVG
jgi:D-sedoheptulose 7-phosphate isomerase